MAETTRSSVLAIVKEVTVGTPILPTSGADFVSLQDGFEMVPEFETLENNELSDSIGVKAPIIGISAPTSSVSAYFRHSGTEATAPAYDELIEVAVGEKVAAHATERALTTGSTAGTSSAAATLVFNTGHGADFQRGKAVLLKDATNGYSIRNIASMSTDTATLAFNLAAAPASGVNTGRAILYKPANTPPSLTMSLYRANGAALEVMAGARVSEMAIEATAGELLNMNFSLEGTSYRFDPIEITASTDTLDFDDGSVKVATVAAALYQDPLELAESLQTAMNAVSSGITVTYNSSGAAAGKFTIAKASGTLTLLFATGANLAQSIAAKIGFAATDLSGFLTYDSTNVQVWAAPYTQTPDANINPLVVKASELMIGDFKDYGCSSAQSFTLTVSNTLQNVVDICETSGVSEKLLQQREVTADVVLTLKRHDAEKFKKFRNGDSITFAFNGGIKSGVNWVAGRCVNVFMPSTSRVTAYSVTDTDGIVTIEMTITCGEVFVNLL